MSLTYYVPLKASEDFVHIQAVTYITPTQCVASILLDVSNLLAAFLLSYHCHSSRVETLENSRTTPPYTTLAKLVKGDDA